MVSTQATLNAQQEKAVAGATGGEGITLIQGPPGTGKTHCALRIITKWLEQRKAELLNVVRQRRERVAQLEGARVRLSPLAEASRSRALAVVRRCVGGCMPNGPCTRGCTSHTDLGVCTWGRLQFADAKEAHILVTGYSNVAVDNIFLGLRAMGVAALRVRSAGGALVGTNELAAVPGTIQYELSRHQKTHLAASLRSQRKMEQV